MDAGLKIKIGAETVEVTQTLDQLRQQLKNFESQLKNTFDPKEVDKLNRSIERTKQIIAGVQNFRLQGSSDQLTQIAGASGKATFALSNLSRTVNDLPFGFVGIQNNISPLFESFQQLQKESGGTKNAFKALGSVLSGPAGPLIGISVLTSLITVAIQKYGSLGNAFGALTGSLTEAEQAQRKLNASLADSEGRAQAEISTVNSLVNIARNRSLADGARQQAIDKLNKEYDNLLPKLTLESIYTDQTTESVTKLTAALERQFKIQGLQNYITKLYEDIAKAQVELLNKSQDTFNSINNLFTDPFATIKLGISAFGVQSTSKDVQQLQTNLEKAQQALNKFREEDAKAGTLFTGNQGQIDQLDKLKAELKNLRGKLEIESDPEKILVLKTSIKGLEDQILKLKGVDVSYLNRSFSELELTIREIKPARIIDPGQLAELRRIQEVLDTGKLSMPDIAGSVKRNGVVLDKQPLDPNYGTKFIERVGDSADKLRERLKNLFATENAEKLSDVVNNTLGKSFQDLFVNIANGGQDAFRQFGQAIKQVITQLISAAAASALVAAIISAITGTPFKVNFKASFAVLSGIKFAEGGIVNKPTYGVFGEAGPEAVIPLATLGTIISSAVTRGVSAAGSIGLAGQRSESLVAQVRGSDLAFVLARTNNTTSRLG